MSSSGILQQVAKIEKSKKRNATHFALCKGENIRYLIALDGGKKKISLNIATYSSKLSLLMKMLDYLPFQILSYIGMGYFCKVILHEEVLKQFLITKSESWNMIVGTYDEKQKVVLQCFSKKNQLTVFIKVGNTASEGEMITEIEFLSVMHNYQNFAIPEILGYQLRNERCPFNILITKEFFGDKVEPVLTEDIINIYREIAGDTIVINGIEYEFSHGDFAPWNIKKYGDRYTVFDWEHCGMRIRGFDLMHFATIIEIVINGKSLCDAFDIALQKIITLRPNFSINKHNFMEEFEKLRVQL